MMRNSIATYKESLSRIASDVQDGTDELEVPAPRGGEDAWFADRRISHRFAQSTSPVGSPVGNGVLSSGSSMAEIELHKAEIQRLKTSEAEVKALAVNYAAMLKEKEEELSRIHEENSSLKKSLEAKTAVAHISKAEDLEVQMNNPIISGDDTSSRFPSIIDRDILYATVFIIRIFASAHSMEQAQLFLSFQLMIAFQSIA